MDFRHLSDASSTKTAYCPKDSIPSCQVHPSQKQPLELGIILVAREFESLRLRYVKEGLAMWLVLFVLAKIDWAKGIGQVLSSVLGGQAWTSTTVGSGGERDVTTLGGHLIIRKK